MKQDTLRHVPVMLAEAVDALAVKPDGVYLDGTFGRGGHAREVLKRLGAGGRLLLLDRDPQAIAMARAEFGQDPRVQVRHGSFADLAEWDATEGGVDGVLLDIGVSSPQLDDPKRGFSFQADAPLDMRMDTSQGETAAQWIAAASERAIAEVVRRYGEERFAKQVAAALVAARARQPIESTGKLAAIVAAAVRTREAHQDPATRTFQAVRIHVNQELEELSLALPQAVDSLNPGGRLAVISFHSLEDRVVKHTFRALASGDAPMVRLLTRRPVTASDAEIEANPRARSAKLRAVERTAQ